MNNNFLQAQRFLDYLGGHTKCWHFQSFDDKKKGGAATTPRGPFNAVLADTLAVANKHGGGVFVAVNSHSPKLVRAKKNTIHVNSLFVDIDDDDAEVAKGKMLSAIKTLPATMVVESSLNKYHVYWCLSDPDSIPVPDFGRWQRRLAKEFDSDSVIHNTDRVMRLPGYMHNKGEPFLTHLVEEHTTGVKHSLDDLVKAFYGGRNNWLTAIAGALRRDAVPAQEISEVLNQRNNLLHVPIDDDEVELISGSVASYTPNPVAERAFETGQLAIQLGLETDRHGNVVPDDRNTMRVVGHEAMIRMNLLSQKHEIQPPVPWSRGSLSAQWEDDDTHCFKQYLNTKYSANWPIMYIESALSVTALNNKYDPLLDYLESLKWDGVPRISTVFQDYLDVEDSPYVRAVSELLFLAGAKRAYMPGCKYDSMIVLVGGEGGGKSLFPSVIAKYEDFHTDSISDIRDKDAVINMAGKWCIEFAELKALQGASAGHTKTFLSTQKDEVRPAYGRRTKIYLRRCFIIGTENNLSFITDSGDNRRILPIYTPKSEASKNVLNYKRLEKVVDQLWAEAVTKYKEDPSVELRMPSDITDETRNARLKFTESGEYEHQIVAYMEDVNGGHVNGQSQKRKFFHAREFYLSLDGSAHEKWGSHGSAIQNRINNSAKKVFALPAWSTYKHGQYSIKGCIVRGWKLTEESNDE